MTPTVAVVIPNRNDSVHLMECLDSVLNQDTPPDQIIFVDDNSTDASLGIVQTALTGIPGVTIVSNPECLGTMGALNEGLKYVTCDYVLFLSSNDFLEMGIFERAKICISKFPVLGVWSAMVNVVDQSGRNKHLYPSPVVALKDAFFPPAECGRLATLTGHWFTGTTLIYNRATLQEIGGFNTSYHGLADLIAALTVASLQGACFSPHAYGVMRQHDGGLMVRTLTNLPLLDDILAKVRTNPASHAQDLFSEKFVDLFQRRIRFTAIRTFQNGQWLAHARSWKGLRYRLLCYSAVVVGKIHILQLAVAFLLLRPPFDIFVILWYRIFGRLVVTMRSS